MMAKRTQTSDRAGAPARCNRPVLVLLAGATDHRAVSPETHLLGLTLRQRAMRAARRAGYARTVIVGSAGSTSDRHIAGEGADGKEMFGRLIVAPTNALAEVSWLEAAENAEVPAGGWGHLPGRVVVVDAAAAEKAIKDLAEIGRLDVLEKRFAERLKKAGALPEAAAPMLIAGPDDLAQAHRRLLRALVKDTDGFMARHIHRPVSIAITARLAETPITPNQMSLVSAAFGLIGAPFFLSAAPIWQTLGALLFLWHSVLDGCDGELARLKFQESYWGGVLDFWGDNVVHIAIFACMGVGWALAIGAGWPLILGAAAVLGTIGSASIVYFRVMRKKDNQGPLYTSVGKGPSEGLTKLLDNASRRDFIYLVLGLSLFGKASWFLVLTAIGAPVYFFLLLIVAAREAGSSKVAQNDAEPACSKPSSSK
ncbi:MAG: CDP-alcohol phosphatidyltransferase family protein [Alphaproteobacteria bacterium]|nr:CDP-alcohol phosphatidyltransferase family protein [Alphaproteobacteria bacterium]